MKWWCNACKRKQHLATTLSAPLVRLPTVQPTCGGLGYATQKAGFGDRASSRADKLRKRLGWEADTLNGNGGKLKGMHWKTYL